MKMWIAVFLLTLYDMKCNPQDGAPCRGRGQLCIPEGKPTLRGINFLKKCSNLKSSIINMVSA